MPATDGDLDLSMNEIEMDALKAARGAGLPWGVAEDVGRAVRWLAGLGVDWSGALLAALGRDGVADPARSPFLIATRVADDAEAPLPAGVDVEDPALLVALLAVCLPADRPLAIAVGSLLVRIGGGRVSASQPDAALVATPRASVTITPIPADAAPLAHPLVPRLTRGRVSAADRAAIEALVYRTYVPTSERSRLRGAGARRDTSLSAA